MTATARAVQQVRAPRRAPSRVDSTKPGKPKKHLRVVDPNVARNARAKRIGVWGIGLLVLASLLAVVTLHATMAEREVLIDRVAEQTARAQGHYQELRLEYARLSTPQAVIDRATGLGMIIATSPRYLSAPGAVDSSVKSVNASNVDAFSQDWGKVKSDLVAAP